MTSQSGTAIAPPNLQLLEGPENVAKKDHNTLAWAQVAFAGETYESHLQLNTLPGLPSSITEFPQWCEQRYKLLEQRLKLLEQPLADLLGMDLAQPTEGDDES